MTSNARCCVHVMLMLPLCTHTPHIYRQSDFIHSDYLDELCRQPEQVVVGAKIV